MKNQNKFVGVALKVFHKKCDLQNYEGTYYLHKKGSIYPDTYNNVCSVYEAKKRLAKTFLLDIKDVEADITKKNIHLYYEFMNDKDIQSNISIVQTIISDRFEIIRNCINIEKENLKLHLNFEKRTVEGNTTIVSGACGAIEIFGVKDTLKPIDEYIAEIKASKEYQEYEQPQKNNINDDRLIDIAHDIDPDLFNKYTDETLSQQLNGTINSIQIDETMDVEKERADLERKVNATQSQDLSQN